jgi:hypothetical protein
MKSSIGLFYQLTVRDRTGKVVRKTRLRRSKSFCIAFLQLIQVQCVIAASVGIRDILNAVETVTAQANNFKLDAAATVDTLGILLGTGTTPVDNTDYVMETKIAHGGAATQLEYGSQGEIAAAEVGANVDYQLVRSFTNSSGGTIQVTEAGVYLNAYAVALKTVLAVHDVFTAVPVLNTETITATYTFKTTV